MTQHGYTTSTHTHTSPLYGRSSPGDGMCIPTTFLISEAHSLRNYTGMITYTHIFPLFLSTIILKMIEHRLRNYIGSIL